MKPLRIFNFAQSIDIKALDLVAKLGLGAFECFLFLAFLEVTDHGTWVRP